jgi:putative hydrolase of the HAD superfamily
VIKAVIFDCFGVLIGRGFEVTYRTAGGNPDQDRTFIEDTLAKANLGQISDAEFRATMARQVGIGPADWSRVIKNTELLNIELLAYIEQLRATYKTAILSNANKGVLDRIIGEEWLQKNFDEIVVSAEVGIAKPDERIYQLVIDRLGVAPEECLYIDDRESFLVPASQLGMSTLLYENFDTVKHGIEELLG